MSATSPTPVRWASRPTRYGRFASMPVGPLTSTQVREPALKELAPNHPLLRRLSRALLEAGEKIVQSNHRLAEQLRRLLDDRALAESRRVRALIDAIKRYAARLADAPPEGVPLSLEGPPEVSMPMEKLLWEPNVATLYAPAVIRLLQGPLSSDDSGPWNMLLTHETPVRGSALNWRATEPRCAT